MIAWINFLRECSGDIRRLTSVVRYSSVPHDIDQNVAEHSFWVAIYAILLHRNISGVADPILERDIMLHALSHDIPECVTGDIVRPFKLTDEQTKIAINRAESLQVARLPEQVRTLMPVFTPYVKRVVRAADLLEVFQYMRRELLHGNIEIRPFAERAVLDFSEWSAQAQEFEDLYKCMSSQLDNIVTSTCAIGSYHTPMWSKP